MASDYDHRFHVGNHADVWKHVAWLALLAGLKREQLAILDTHAGRGGYALDRPGEWRDGVGRLLEAFPDGASTGSGAVDRYLARIRRHGPGRYPGSPVLSIGAMGRADRLVAHELDPDAAKGLRRALDGDSRAAVREDDGFAAAAGAEPGAVVLIDPPYVSPKDWTDASDAVVAAGRARVMLWYPIKRWTRPNALLARIAAAGVRSVALDLLVDPDLKGSSLGGSGVVLVNAPPSVLVELAAAGPVLGPILGVEGRWRLRVTGS